MLIASKEYSEENQKDKHYKEEFSKVEREKYNENKIHIRRK
jgi:hypothetical protein